MAASIDQETLNLNSDPNPSIRRRHPAAFPAGEALTTDSGEDSSLDTSSDADTRDFAEISGRKEKQKEKEKKEKKEVRSGPSGEGDKIPPKYLFRAAMPANRRVKESPLSSDAI